MRKLYYIIILFLSTCLIGGCTLVLDEMENYVPEEQRGIDEPYTEVIPGVITTTYKYNEGVRPVTTNMKDYIASVEADTIIYFFDNIPSDMLPERGEYLACGCHPKIPEGLNNKVLSVTNINGLYKVVTTRVDIKDVYEMLTYDIDASVAPQYGEFYPSQSYRDSLESIGECEAIDDWSLFDTSEYSSFLTRAKTDTIVTSEKDSVSEYGFSFDSRVHMGGIAEKDFIKRRMKAYLQKMVKFCNDKNIDMSPFIAVRIENKNRIRILSRLDTRTDYEYNATEEINEQVFAIDAGLEVGWEKDTAALNNEKIAKAMNSNRMKKLADSKFAKKLTSASAKLKGMTSEAIEAVSSKIKIRMPGPVPISWQFEINIAFNVSVQGTVSACWTTTTKSITGYEIKDDVVYPINNKKEPNKDTDFTFLLSGGFDIGFKTEAKASVIFFESIGSAISATLSAGVKGEAQFKFLENKKENEEEEDDEDEKIYEGEISPYCDLTASLEIFFSPLGLDVWDASTELGSIPFYEKKHPVAPKLSLASMPATKIDYPDYTKLIYAYSISDLGVSPDPDKYQPLLAVYKNEVNRKNHFADLYIGANEFARTNVEYRFEQDIPKDSVDVEYISIPLLYNTETKARFLYTDYKHKYGKPEPRVEIVEFYQNVGKEYKPNSFDFTDDDLNAYISDTASHKLYEYGFAVVVDLSYASHIKDGWGIVVNIKRNGMQELCNEWMFINRYKAKRYTLNFKFVSDVDVNDGDVLDVSIRPFMETADNEQRKTIMLSLPPDKHKSSGDSGTVVDVNL